MQLSNDAVMGSPLSIARGPHFVLTERKLFQLRKVGILDAIVLTQPLPHRRILQGAGQLLQTLQVHEKHNTHLSAASARGLQAGCTLQSQDFESATRRAHTRVDRHTAFLLGLAWTIRCEVSCA